MHVGSRAPDPDVLAFGRDVAHLGVHRHLLPSLFPLALHVLSSRPYSSFTYPYGNLPSILLGMMENRGEVEGEDHEMTAHVGVWTGSTGGQICEPLKREMMEVGPRWRMD